MSLKCLNCGSEKLDLVEFVKETLSTPIIKGEPDYDLTSIPKSDTYESYVECQKCFYAMAYTMDEKSDKIILLEEGVF